MDAGSAGIDERGTGMILIIGPAYGGKAEFARQILKSSQSGGTADTCISAEDHPDAGSDLQSDICPDSAILTEVQDLITDETVDEDIPALAEGLCKKARILTASETGAGIVPIDPKERKRRELQGKLLQELAARSEEVVRVFYGIGERIK